MKIVLRIIKANIIVNIESPLTNIKVISPQIYRELLFNYQNEFMIYENNEEVNLDHDTLILKSPLTISLNDKNVISHIYKNMEKNLTDVNKQTINQIESTLLSLIEELLSEYPIKFTYNSNIEINKILGLYRILIEEENNNFLQHFVNYIKIYNEVKVKTIKYIICFDLLRYLNQDEITILNKEISLLGLYLINIDYGNNNELNENIISIDDDWCVF